MLRVASTSFSGGLVVLDLFDFIPEIAAERQAQARDLAVSPLLVLRDAMPEAS
jgi:hypothetical protein